MGIGIHSKGTKAVAGKREDILWFSGLLLVSWVLGGVWGRAEILYVLEEHQSEKAYQKLKANAGELPPEVKLDEYLLEAEMLESDKDHEGALKALDRIVALQKEHGLKLPEEFLLQYAQTALAAGSYQVAMDAATQYLSKAGRGDKHYRKALGLLVKSKRGPPPPPRKKEPIRVGGDVQASRLVHRVEPEYPKLAKRARVSGTVILQVIVSEGGTVQEVKIVRGHPLLNEAATRAVRQWRYSPYLLNGEPIPVIATVPVDFDLR